MGLKWFKSRLASQIFNQATCSISNNSSKLRSHTKSCKLGVWHWLNMQPNPSIQASFISNLGKSSNCIKTTTIRQKFVKRGDLNHCFHLISNRMTCWLELSKFRFLDRNRSRKWSRPALRLQIKRRKSKRTKLWMWSKGATNGQRGWGQSFLWNMPTC